MKKILLILAFALSLGANAQQTQAEAQASVDSIIVSNNTRSITASGLRFAFRKILNFFTNNMPVTPERYGAKGDGVTNDLAAFQAMHDAHKKGEITYTKGKTYKIVGTLNITGYGNESYSLKISAYGSKIITTNPVGTPVIVFDNCMRTTVKGLECDGSIDFDGWYFGNMEDCMLKRVRAGYLNRDTIDEFYWSTFKKCKIANGLYIYTGTAGDRTEFNSNSFYDCNLWYDTFAIHIYGNQLAQNNNFYSCDLSYQTVGRMEIEQNVLDAQFNFYTAYWDDDMSIPVNTKNVVINTYGYGNNPNSGNVGQHATLNTGSQNHVSSSFGGRTGNRIAYSPVNILTNGDLRAGKSDIVTDWANMTLTPGSGAYGHFLRFSDNTGSLKTAEWKTIKAPYSGWYAVTLIGRNVGNTNIVFSNAIDGTDVYYNPVSVNDMTDFVVSTGKVKLVQDQVYSFRLFNAPGSPNVVDVSGVSVTYGVTGGLMTTPHPHAETVKTVLSYYEGSAANVMYTLPIAENERIAAKCTCYGWDHTYPDGATYNEMIVVASKSNTEYTYSITPSTTVKTGAMSAAPTYTLTASGGNLLLNATPADGVMRLTCELRGIFKLN